MYFYTIESNYTLRPNSFFISFNLPVIKDLALLKLKTDIDSSIADYHLNLSSQKSIEFDISWSDFPSVPDRFIGGFSIITATGAMYLFFVPLGVFIVFFMKISH